MQNITKKQLATAYGFTSYQAFKRCILKDDVLMEELKEIEDNFIESERRIVYPSEIRVLQKRMGIPEEITT